MWALDEPVGDHRRRALSPQQTAPRPGSGNQAGDEVHRPSPPRPLGRDLRSIDERLVQLVAEAAPAALVALKGVGTDTALSLLIAAGDNPERLSSEAAAFARLCGVAPIQASYSGTIRRHRLNRGGNREANRALYVFWCLDG